MVDRIKASCLYLCHRHRAMPADLPVARPHAPASAVSAAAEPARDVRVSAAAEPEVAVEREPAPLHAHLAVAVARVAPPVQPSVAVAPAALHVQPSVVVAPAALHVQPAVAVALVAPH